MHNLKYTVLCVSLPATSKWSWLGLRGTHISGRRDPISFTLVSRPCSSSSSSSSAYFCPWSHPLKSWQMWNLSYPWASTQPIAVGNPKWFRSSLMSLWMIFLLQKKGGEQMCKTEIQRYCDNHISLLQKGEVSACTGLGREREVYVQQNSRNLKHRYQIRYVHCVQKFPSENISFWMI